MSTGDFGDTTESSRVTAALATPGRPARVAMAIAGPAVRIPTTISGSATPTNDGPRSVAPQSVLRHRAGRIVLGALKRECPQVSRRRDEGCGLVRSRAVCYQLTPRSASVGPLSPSGLPRSDALPEWWISWPSPGERIRSPLSSARHRTGAPNDAVECDVRDAERHLRLLLRAERWGGV